MQSTAKQLLSRHRLISDQVTASELLILLEELETVITADPTRQGSVVEFGCYSGTTSLFITRLLQAYKSKFSFAVYDSFAGLPKKLQNDNNALGVDFVEGALKSSKSTFIQNFKKAQLPLPLIHTCWFESLNPESVPPEIVFAFLDGDFYSSISSSLALIWPKLSKKSVVVVDDYANPALPGAKKAVDEWLLSHPSRLLIKQSLAIIKPI